MTNNNCKICGIALPVSKNPIVVCPDCSHVYRLVHSSKNDPYADYSENLDIAKSIEEGLFEFLEVYHAPRSSSFIATVDSVFNFNGIIVGFSKSTFEYSYAIRENTSYKEWMTGTEQVATRPYRVFYIKEGDDFIFHQMYYPASSTVGDILLSIVETVLMLDSCSIHGGGKMEDYYGGSMHTSNMETSSCSESPNLFVPTPVQESSHTFNIEPPFVPEPMAMPVFTSIVTSPPALKTTSCTRCNTLVHIDGTENKVSEFVPSENSPVDVVLCDKCYSLYKNDVFRITKDIFANCIITLPTLSVQPQDEKLIEKVNAHLFALSKIHSSKRIDLEVDYNEVVGHIKATEAFLRTDEALDKSFESFAFKALDALEFYKTELSI